MTDPDPRERVQKLAVDAIWEHIDVEMWGNCDYNLIGRDEAAAAIADAVLAALQLEQVGWRSEFDDEFYDMRYERPEVTPRWEPVFRLAVGER